MMLFCKSSAVQPSLSAKQPVAPNPPSDPVPWHPHLNKPRKWPLSLEASPEGSSIVQSLHLTTGGRFVIVLLGEGALQVHDTWLGTVASLWTGAYSVTCCTLGKAKEDKLSTQGNGSRSSRQVLVAGTEAGALLIWEGFEEGGVFGQPTCVNGTLEHGANTGRRPKRALQRLFSIRRQVGSAAWRSLSTGAALLGLSGSSSTNSAAESSASSLRSPSLVAVEEHADENVPIQDPRSPGNGKRHSGITCCSFNHEGRILITGGLSGEVLLWDLDSQQEPCKVRDSKEENHPVLSVASGRLPDSRGIWVAAAIEGSLVQVWELASRDSSSSPCTSVERLRHLDVGSGGDLPVHVWALPARELKEACQLAVGYDAPYQQEHMQRLVVWERQGRPRPQVWSERHVADDVSFFACSSSAPRALQIECPNRTFCILETVGFAPLLSFKKSKPDPVEEDHMPKGSFLSALASDAGHFVALDGTGLLVLKRISAKGAVNLSTSVTASCMSEDGNTLILAKLEESEGHKHRKANLEVWKWCSEDRAWKVYAQVPITKLGIVTRLSVAQDKDKNLLILAVHKDSKGVYLVVFWKLQEKLESQWVVPCREGWVAVECQLSADSAWAMVVVEVQGLKASAEAHFWPLTSPPGLAAQGPLPVSQSLSFLARLPSEGATAFATSDGQQRIALKQVGGVNSCQIISSANGPLEVLGILDGRAVVQWKYIGDGLWEDREVLRVADGNWEKPNRMIVTFALSQCQTNLAACIESTQSGTREVWLVSLSESEESPKEGVTVRGAIIAEISFEHDAPKGLQFVPKCNGLLCFGIGDDNKMMVLSGDNLELLWWSRMLPSQGCCQELPSPSIALWNIPSMRALKGEASFGPMTVMGCLVREQKHRSTGTFVLVDITSLAKYQPTYNDIVRSISPLALANQEGARSQGLDAQEIGFMNDLLRQWPCVLNIREEDLNSLGQRTSGHLVEASLLSGAIYLRRADLLELLLATPQGHTEPVALDLAHYTWQDYSGGVISGDLIGYAVERGDVHALAILLDAIPKRTTPAARGALVGGLVAVTAAYPMLMVPFLDALGLASPPPRASAGVEWAPLRGKVETTGSCQVAPARLWKNNLQKLEEKSRGQMWGGSGQPVDARFISMAGLANICGQAAEESSLFYMLVRHCHNRKDVFLTPPIRALISYKWNKYGRQKLMTTFITFLVYLVSFLAFLAIHAERPHTRIRDKQGIAATVLGVIILILNFHYAVRYRRSWLLRGGTIGFWVIAHALVLITVILQFIKMSWPREDPIPKILLDSTIWVGAFASHTLCLRSLWFLKSFEATGPLVATLMEVAWDIKPFLLVLIIVLLSFSQAFYVLYSNGLSEQVQIACSETYSPFDSWPRSSLFLFISMFGQVDLCPFIKAEPEAFRVLATFYMVLFMLSVAIILLTILIAIISRAYERVQQSANAHFLYGRAAMIVATETNMSRTERVNPEWFPAWVHALVPRAKDARDISSLNDVAALTRKKASLMEDHFSNLQEEVGALRHELKELHALLRPTLKAQQYVK